MDNLKSVQAQIIRAIEMGPNSEDINLPNELPVLALRNSVFFPDIIVPISVSREESKKLIRKIHHDAQKPEEKLIAIISQTDGNTKNPSPKDLYTMGTIGQLLELLELPGGLMTAIIRGIRKIEVTQLRQAEHIFAQFNPIKEVAPENPQSFANRLERLKVMAEDIVQLMDFHIEAGKIFEMLGGARAELHFMCMNFDIPVKSKQELLECDGLDIRADKLQTFLEQEIKKYQIRKEIFEKTKEDLDQQQREYFLNQQLRHIQEELGGSPQDNEINELNNKAQKKKWSKEVKKHFQAEVGKLRHMNPAAADYGVQLSYLNTLISLPWNEYTKDRYDIARAKNILERDHYGLEKVKERVLEHLAVLQFKKDMKAPILCLYGPPGVGKTSLGKSIAKAIGRKYIRMALGGIHDEAEIRGHRKTYIGSMPGRIIQGLKKAGYANPVFILDEIDKLSTDFRGDPSSALLEVLDPEQNEAFHDNYIDVDFDLSKVMFIATANSLSSIQPALLDRMEVIELTGYLQQEKVEIAKRHLLPKQGKLTGLDDQTPKITKTGYNFLIESYTRESGVRQLDKTLAKLCRKVAKKILDGETFDQTLKPEHIKTLLSEPRFVKSEIDTNHTGVATGLAWTSMGGEVLQIEATLSNGNGDLKLTGNLGEVMKESAMIALSYVQSRAEKLGIDAGLFKEKNVHIHVPEGAIPKDGPSAGITMITALVSLYIGKKVSKGFAMTGETTLRGRVLPVGGIKEKVLAAKRWSLNNIILCEQNRRDINEIKEDYIKGMTFHYVKDVQQVLNIVLGQ